MTKLDFADRIKALEMLEAGRTAMPGLPVMARLDGRAFHSLCRGFDRPYDQGMSTAMTATAVQLVAEFMPACGYTQSDEITLAWLEPDIFDGRFQKLTSVLASYAAGVFGPALREARPNSDPKQVPCFDCRVWQVPSIQDVMDVFIWREDDAVKNSITMAAQAYYTHGELMGVKSSEKHELLHAKGVNWNDYAPRNKRGVYVKRVVETRPMTDAEWSRIPEKHRPSERFQPISRSSVQELELPPIRGYADASKVLLGVDVSGSPTPKYEVTCAQPLTFGLRASVEDT